MGFFRGFWMLPYGGYFLMKHPRLWPLAVLPLVINLVLFGVFGAYAVTHLLPWLVDWITPQIHLPTGEGWFAQLAAALPAWTGVLGTWFRSIVKVLAYIISLILLLVVCGFSFTAVGTVLAAPFNDALSERVEEMLNGTVTTRPFSFGNLFQDVVRTVIQALRKLLVVLLVFVFTLPLLLIPVLGPIGYTVLNGLVATWFLAMEYVDLPMGRVGWSIRERGQWAWDRKRAMLGFGSGVYITFLVPLLGYLVMPAAVVGGTLLFVRLSHKAPEK